MEPYIQKYSTVDQAEAADVIAKVAAECDIFNGVVMLRHFFEKSMFSCMKSTVALR